MDKNAIKKYAVWARRELIMRVAGCAAKYGITEDDYGDVHADSVDGRVLSSTEKEQRKAFIEKVHAEGYEQAVEEVAYTWFNRFCALRYMEVNGYLPTHIRVFTNEDGEFKPYILDEAIHLELAGVDMEKVFALKDANEAEELYRYLLITQCNALSWILPGVFQKIADYTELLMPDNLLREGSVIERMVAQIPEEDWSDQVQIIGWLYQYYNAEKKDEVFAALKKKVKITKENIPAATQLFTPDWIVRYMVENSLGRFWVEGHPNEELKSGWKYYLEETEQEPEVEAQLIEIRKEYAALKPEDIKCIDPCCGSGHILVYMFDVLMQIYESYGYTTQNAVGSIIENNLYGLDIDERAAQLAYFAVMMKARSYDRRFFDRDIQPHVYAIRESNKLDKNLADYFIGNDPKLKQCFGTLIEELHDAKEYGSILHISQVDFSSIYARVEEVRYDISFHAPAVEDTIVPLIQVAQMLAQKYDVVVTNPPYMAPTEKQKPYLQKKFLSSKNDMAMVFMEQNLWLCNLHGFSAMINFPTWMFLSSYEKLREKIVNDNTIVCMVYPGRGIFGSDFGTTCFVMNKYHISNYTGVYCKLFDQIGEVESVENRERQFLQRKGINTFNQQNFTVIQGTPIAFWITDNFLETFRDKKIGDLSVAKAGIVSGNDDYFLRLWFEVDFTESTFDATNFDDHKAYKWVPINKGGAFRRYYGNYEYVINIYDLWNKPDKVNVSVRRSEPQYYFKKALTWSSATMGASSFRITNNKLSSTAAPCLYFKNDDNLYVALALLNSCFTQKYLDLLNPTVSLNTSNVSAVPALNFEKMAKLIRPLCEEIINISKDDWDSFEISWDFICHPLIPSAPNFGAALISEIFDEWSKTCHERYERVRKCSSMINKILISNYGLESEESSFVEDKDISIRLADVQRDVQSLISYAVGCMFGRYSLDMDGLAYAGGEWDVSRYQIYPPDNNGILPICDDEYFEDDIGGHFIDFIRVVYGPEHLEENLQFVANALKGKGNPREIIRNYFINDFYKDHCNIYSGTVGKRPIYWLFDSGKKNGFKCLIYVHRYRPDIIARIRTDYVHEQQARYHTAIADLQSQIDGASTSERIKLSKDLKKLQEQADELLVYEEKIHHLADQFIDINLDDGVKVNYAKFQDVLAKIK